MIYLDNHATTRIDPRVLDAMMPTITGDAWGNPSSTHRVGVAARRALEDARLRALSLLPGRRRKLIFTSGATEANALALLGRAPKGRRKKVVITALEHPSIGRTTTILEQRGCQVRVVSPDQQGLVNVDSVLEAVDQDTALLAMMLVNNEVGTVQPVGQLSRLLKRQYPRCHLHVDAAQAIGLVELNEELTLADSVSLSAHKFHGPRGSGALLFNEQTPPRPLWAGGNQELGLRSGTQNVSSAVGFTAALALALEGWKSRAEGIAALRDRLIAGIIERVPDALLVGHPKTRSPANAMIAVPGLTSDVMVGALDQRGVIASTGSACHSSDPHPSEVLQAMGHDLDAGTVRFGLARDTTEDEIEQAIDSFSEAVESLRRSRR